MDALIIWWLAIQVLGFSALPLARHIFRWLPDEGYAFAKPLGILLCSYALWLGASLGIVDNNRPAIVVIVILFAAVCWVGPWNRLHTWSEWWRRNRGSVIAVELLFAVGLVALALLRAYDPAIVATEKPMEFAFLNAVLRSERFPPVDPWLAGHSISYYYFGYVMVAFLTKLSGLAASYTFNLAVAMLFALTLTGAFGVVSNLVRLSPRGSGFDQPSGIGYGLLGSAFVAILGNLEGIVEVLNARGLVSASVHSWLHIKDLPAVQNAGSWLPSDYWWWFRASRVVGDFDPLTGVSRDYTINEFPFFSFLLGDLHPHVLALPFTIMCLGLALNLMASRDLVRARGFFRQRADLVVLALAFGGLAFLNSWDLPTYLLILVLAFAVRRYWQDGSFRRPQLQETVIFGGLVLIVGILLYAPFYLTFSSQARGFGLVPVRTKLHHFLIFWGPFAFLVVAFLMSQLWLVSRRGAAVTTRGHFRLAKLSAWWLVVLLAIALAALGAEVLAVLLLGLVVGVRIFLAWASRPRQPLTLVQAKASIPRGSGSPALVGNLDRLTLAASDSSPEHDAYRPGGRTTIESSDPSRPGDLAFEHGAAHLFALALIVVSLGLLAGSEVLFLRDFFGNRMNTIFKVYYQVWTMLALASAYVLYYLSRQGGRGGTPGLVRQAVVGLFAVIALACLVYPVASSTSKSGGFASAPNFDGMSYLKTTRPHEYEAINWLQSAVKGTPVILEAAGKSYSEYGRISANTGLPTVVGWDFHEMQWRGSYREAGQRKGDVERMYKTDDIETAKQLMRQYGVTYVYVGELERAAYGGESQAALQKFGSFMDVVYRNPGVTIYSVRRE